MHQIVSNRRPTHALCATDYSWDECLYEFSPDQIKIMQAAYAVYRTVSVERHMHELENGQPSIPVTLLREERQYYSYTPTPDSVGVTCSTTFVDSETNLPCSYNCFNGDVELSLAWDELPGGSSGFYDCLSYERASVFEQCSLSRPLEATTLYIALDAITSFVDAQIVCADSIPLQNATASVHGRSVDTDGGDLFHYETVSHRSNVTCRLETGIPGPVLYVGYSLAGMFLGGDQVECESASLCFIPDVRWRTDIHVHIDFPGAFFDSIQLTCLEESFPPLILENTVQYFPLSMNVGEAQLFVYPLEVIDVPGTVTCLARGPDGDADLYLRFDETPTWDTFVCGGVQVGSREMCVLSIPVEAKDLFVLVHASWTFSLLELICIESHKTPFPSDSPHTSLLEPSSRLSRPPTFEPSFPQPSGVPGSSLFPLHIESDTPSKVLPADRSESPRALEVSTAPSITPCARWLDRCVTPEHCCRGVCRLGRCRLF